MPRFVDEIVLWRARREPLKVFIGNCLVQRIHQQTIRVLIFFAALRLLPETKYEKSRFVDLLLDYRVLSSINTMAGDDHNKYPVVKITRIKTNGTTPKAGKYFLGKFLSLKVIFRKLF